MKKKKEKQAPSSGTSRKGTALWLILILFISAWMFVLGILVGRETAPIHFDIEALQKELAALKEAVLQKEQKRYKIRSKATQDKPDLGFHEALKDSKADARPGLEAPGPLKSPPEKRISALGPKKSFDNTGPSRSLFEKRPVSSSKVNEIGGGFTVQVAALKESKFADSMVADLKQKGYPAYWIKGLVPGKGVWYRIRIGSFKSKTDALGMVARLKKDKLNGIVVRK